MKIDDIVEVDKCCGCTACLNICPQNCITMQKNYEGFLVPIRDDFACTKCTLCERVCPILNKPINNNKAKALIARTTRLDILMDSTSGGIFTPIAELILEQSGIVFGATFDHDFSIIHLEGKDAQSLGQFRGSKYVQSDLGNTFKQCKSYLDLGEKVLYSGTPCQIAGLKNYLGKDYNSLYTLDLVCKGVASPLVWGKYLDFQVKKYKSKIKHVRFRRKTYGYHSSTMSIIFENKKEYNGSGRVDYMLKSYYKEFCSRKSCHSCMFKSENHVSDITIFDGWHYTQLTNKKDDDRGYTNAFINSRKGESLFELLKNRVRFDYVDIESAINLDGKMVRKSSVANKHREDFLKCCIEVGIEEAIQNYLPVTKADLIFERSKRILYKLKILKILKILKK